MQGVFTKFLQLWIPNKTDKGTVVTDVFEPNFTKLDQNAEATNRTLTNLSNNKLDKGTYPGNASDLKSEIDKIASNTQLGRIKVGTNLRIDENGFLHGNPDVNISGKMDKYKDVTSIISDYDDLVMNGFYIVYGSNSGVVNSPHVDAMLVQVWEYAGLVYQRAVSPYDTSADFIRCFEAGFKNTKWKKIVHTTDIVNNLTTTVPEKVLDARQGKKLFDEKLDKGNVTEKYNTAEKIGIELDKKQNYSDSGLKTNAKTVIAAINELNSRGFVKIGECSIVNQSVSIYGYNEFVVCEKFSQNGILDIKYFTKDIVNCFKGFEFVSHGGTLECQWFLSADGRTITLKDLGLGSDGGIDVYGR